MNIFKDEDAYRTFAQVVKRERRWVFDAKVNAFLSSVRTSSVHRERFLTTGQELWRCQRGSKPGSRIINGAEIDFNCPHPRKRMLPDPRFGKGGRANPPSIAYFYAANNPETAMAEMRLSVGEHVTVCLFEVVRKQRIVVCGDTNDGRLDKLFSQKSSPGDTDRCVWGDISEAFSRPVNAEDPQLEYIPTQILAELFKDEGFDGVAYRSGLSQGTNLVLFNKRAAKYAKGYVYRLKKVRYTFVSEDMSFTIVKKENDGLKCRDEITTETPH